MSAVYAVSVELCKRPTQIDSRLFSKDATKNKNCITQPAIRPLAEIIKELSSGRVWEQVSTIFPFEQKTLANITGQHTTTFSCKS